MVDSVYVRRYGKRRELILRYVLERGSVDENELHEKFGSKTSRLRDFRRRLLSPLLDDGVLVASEAGSAVLPAPD